ncbi:MAG TPA: CoA-binding protein [Candidatus Binataceae bacterium]|nr:CoA-binding protein [Candidatus Binataceae bacterium]
MRFENPDDAAIKAILSRPSTVAVIGCSDNPARDSLRIARLWKSHGFRVIPVNPQLSPSALEAMLGERCYPDLASIPGPVEIVDVFRRSEYLAAAAEEAIAKRARVLWCQLGVIDDAAAARAQAAGLTVLMDRCPAIEYARLFNPGHANLPIGVQKDAIEENGAPREPGAPGWHSRGYLPHFESAEVTQHVTFHLADSLPQSVILRLDDELKALPAEKREAERRERLDAWIDAGLGSCILRDARIAAMVQGSLLAFDSRRYRMLAWVVMPNHVHVLFQPINGWTVAKIVAAWKKFTAHKICDALRDSGGAPGAPVWHREYWDRYIRSQRHVEQVIEYIHQIPVKAGLAATAESWRWSSAYSGAENYANREIGVPGWKP